MLKIKDGVNIKDLLKFGFKRTAFSTLIIKNSKQNKRDIDFSYWIDTKDRIIKVKKCYDETTDVIDDTLYDLIKADLVEKVDE